MQNKITPEQVRTARKRAGLTQKEAAELIGKPVRTWQNWEAPTESPSHRSMDSALFKLFEIQTKRKRLVAAGG